MAPNERFREAISRIDEANAADPNRLVVGGEARPKELVHAELVTEWVTRLRPDAGEALLIAARGHHIRRWTVPRSAYPEGRAGYLRWRRELQEVHARELGAILEAAGYDLATAERVQHLVRKRNLASDPDVQVLEDALCLVFLETQFAELAARTETDRMIEIVRKTLAKMSDSGRQAAMALPMSESETMLVEQALAS